MREAKPNDRIVFLATKNERTKNIDERGKILGMAEIGTRQVNTLDVVSKETLQQYDLIENGEPKFNAAIPMLRAWRFINPPLLSELFDKPLPPNAMTQAILLDSDKAIKILALPHEEIILQNSEVLNQERMVAERKILLPSKGIAPSNGERNFLVKEKEFGYVYAFRFGKRDVWKIGNSYNPDERLDQVNKHIPDVVLNEKWAIYARQKLQSAKQAFDIETQMKEAMKSYSIGGEMFSCKEQILNDKWEKIVVDFLMVI